MACITSGGISDPPRTVTTPTPLITGLTPRLAYKEDVEVAVRLTPGAAAAAAGANAEAWSRRRREVFMSISILIYFADL
jgi:hypothetical protein